MLPILLSSHNPQSLSSGEILNKMFAATDKVSTLKFKLKKLERVAGNLKAGEQDVKFNRNPKKIYTKVIFPNRGVEVLYLDGQNGNKAYVNPNGFPYVTVSLDPYSSSMRNNNHHTVHEVGFDYINSIVSYIAKKSDKDFEKIFQYTGDTVFSGRSCHKIVIDYTPYAYVDYTVKAGETVTSIAYKLFISDYMILQLNKNISDYEDVKEGQVIKVPNAYARKTILLIDKENFLPIVQKMYDEKGLFSQYEFHSLQLNPKIAEEEFTKEYKDYDF
ncbi:MAG: DUF1571 domain-containing protein [Cytophagaceae bacterium]|nr:DUF1571 domain-containing protein [Cytophagaceae bacterium]